MIGVVLVILYSPWFLAPQLAVRHGSKTCHLEAGGLLLRGFYEEIFSRLFLLTLIAWLANKALRKPGERLSDAAFWISNLIVAVLFGLGHLPSASLMMPITPLVVAVALSFNGIAAIALAFFTETGIGNRDDGSFHCRLRHLCHWSGRSFRGKSVKFEALCAIMTAAFLVLD